MELPTWWLALSSLFFLCAIAATVAVIVLLLKVMAIVKQLEPKMNELAHKVNKIGERVESIAGKVDDIATHAKGTALTIRERTDGFARTAGALALLTGKKSATASNWITVGATVLGFVRSFMANRRAHAASRSKD